MDYKDRIKKAKGVRDLWRGTFQSAYDYIIPERNGWTRRDQGQEENQEIYDETAVLALPQFANRMQRSIVPDWQQWINFVAGDEIPKDAEVSVDQQLEQATEVFFAYLHSSNFSTEINPAFIDAGISTGAIFKEELPIGEDHLFRFVNIPLHELCPEPPVDGVLCNLWWPRKVSGETILRKWEKDIPAKLREMIEKDKSAKHEICTGQVKDGRKYKISVVWEGEAFIENEYPEPQMFAFGLTAMPGEVYRRGPGLQVLPAIRRVNAVQRFILENAAIQVAGIYTAIDDGVFNPYTTTIEPGTILPVSSNNNQNPTLRGIERAGDLGMGQLIIEEMQDTIRKAFFVDPMGDISDPVRTAYEQQQRMTEFLKNQGAAIGRLKTELLDPLVRSVVGTLKRRGKFPDVRVDGHEVAIRHVSPLAQAEKLEDFQNARLFLDSVQLLPPEIVGGSFKVEELPKYMAEKLGLPKNLVRSEVERQQVAQAAREMVNGQQEAEQG